MVLYSGHEEENAPHTQGIALMLSKGTRNSLVGLESHGSTIIKASFKTKKEGITMNVIQCYAPTNDSNDDDKDQFYDRLFQALQDLLKQEETTKGIKEPPTSTCHEVLDLKKHHHKQWISIETMD
ncbi:unnamed protein product [Schistosoma curassoni]|uniref:RanBD1 domain-containing protein n=1 Tax=Schistosoma curassoni TaxID=6186 RepID=A0A183KV76_9TREM|nr:unnamed protein product [Schistosoma curassoni]